MAEKVTRPGGTKCAACRVIFPYAELNPYRSRQWICDLCLERKERLGLS